MYLSQQLARLILGLLSRPGPGFGWLPLEVCDPPSASDLELDLNTNKNMDKKGIFVGKARADKTNKGER
jgi:hypothetical protein